MGKAMFAAVGIILAELYTGKVGYGFMVYRGSLWHRVDHSRPSYLALSSLSGSNVKLSFVASRAHGLVV